MAQLSLQCPHCRAEKIGFSARAFHQVKPGHPLFLIFLQCEGCGHGVIAEVQNSPNGVQAWMANQAHSVGQFTAIYPSASALKAPADIPPNVESAFLSGVDNLGRKNGTNAAAIMFRRSIELAAKQINPNAPKGQNLKKKIEDLPPEMVTPAMKKWAQQIRLDGNDAAHEDEEFSDSDARQLHIFAEMFLTYAFTLPAMLERATETEKST